MRISDWSSDVCSSDLRRWDWNCVRATQSDGSRSQGTGSRAQGTGNREQGAQGRGQAAASNGRRFLLCGRNYAGTRVPAGMSPQERLERRAFPGAMRSDEHTSELQSLMRNSYAVICLKKKRGYRTIITILIRRK